MKNKILVRVYVVSISEEFEMYIPSNESVKNVIDLINKSVIELSDDRFEMNDNKILMDGESGKLYEYASIIRDVNIINGQKLFLI